MPSTAEVLETLHAKYAGHPVDTFELFAAQVKHEALKSKLLVDVLPVPEGSCTILRRQLTEDEALALLASLDPSDPERAHGEADWVLLASVPQAVADAYFLLEDTAPWWVSA